MTNGIFNLVFRGFLAISFLALPANAHSQEKKAITYDQIEHSAVDFRTYPILESDITVSDSYRTSSTEDTFYCENHTLTYKFSQNFKNRIRSDQSLEVLFDGKKVDPKIVRQKSDNFDAYKFYDVKYRCIDQTAGLLIYGYKPGLNGSASSAKVFSIFFELDSGDILE